jgi:hypothetical protein
LVVTPDQIRRSWDDDDTPRSHFPTAPFTQPRANRDAELVAYDQLSRENVELWAEVERLRAAELDAAAHRHCLEAIAASPAPEATTSEGIYWLTEKLANARRDTWADIAATLNDRAVMWEQEGRRMLAEECKGMANACRTYAEGVGVPAIDSLRRKRRAAEARLDALVADLRWLADDMDERGRPGASDSPMDAQSRRQVREDVKRLRAVLDKHAGEQP